jgi:23S rRNA (adenine2503-C2)-methyltransferase
MRLSHFTQRLATLGARPVHIGRILRVWLNAQALDTGTRRRRAEDFLPLALRDALPAITAELDGLARIRSEHPGHDGSRLLVDLADGQMVESVLLPRDGLCVSTQVGCAVGCRFCMTGKSGLLRQVTSMEILAQVVLARRQRPVK